MRLISEDSLAATTIFQEAEGESYRGKLAVAWVLRNRMFTHFFSDGTVAGTVLRSFQFSGWNTNSANRIRSVKIDTDVTAMASDCVKAWKESGAGEDITKGAVQYYNFHLVAPSWASNFIETVRIGQHRFMKINRA